MSNTQEILSDLVFCPRCLDKYHGYLESKTPEEFTIYCQTCDFQAPAAKTLELATKAWDEEARRVFTANLGRQYATLTIFPFYGPPVATTDFSVTSKGGAKDRIEINVDGVTEQRLSSLKMFEGGHSVYGTISDSARSISAFVAKMVGSDMVEMGDPEHRKTDVWVVWLEIIAMRQITCVFSRNEGGRDRR